MNVRAIRTSLFRQGEDLVGFIVKHIPRIRDRSVIVVTSKIVALSERRTIEITNRRDKERIIRSESQWVMRTKWTWLTIKDNMVMSSAGIDESNADGKLILLPHDSFKTASQLRLRLRRAYKLRRLGVLITDSRLFPLRAGVVGVALGYAGFRGVRDERGKPDLFGRKLKLTRVDVADSLATAAVLEMGEAAERQPLAILENTPVEFVERVNRKELTMDFRDDVYAPLFRRAGRIRLKRVRGPW